MKHQNTIHARNGISVKLFGNWENYLVERIFEEPESRIGWVEPRFVESKLTDGVVTPPPATIGTVPLTEPAMELRLWIG